jgi:alginate O-acetyltransferase complex protein AlgI
MLFHTTRFFLFLAVVLPAFYLAPRRFRNLILLAASYYFYMCWNARFLVLLLVLTAIDYTAALAMTGARRRAWLIASLAANLGFLGFFKYFNFLASNIGLLLGTPIKPFDIILPMGISFHTFQSMSYVIDVYRGEQQPIRNIIDYALYIAFFPQLVAGPIVRARHFFADLYNWRAPLPKEQLRGTLLTIFGLVKKVAIADQFARLSDAYFSNPAAHHGAWAAWSGAAAFSMQIFFDFSGYTDMAIGLAQLFGFHFPDNFRRPYLAGSITEFWRRWHISLSSWLRDYLYIPLGGNRGGRLQTYRNLMLTMLLGGLWHGASWNFVIWGGYHGAILVAEKATGHTGSPRLGVPFTFALATLGWVFFRASTFAQSTYVVGQMFSLPLGHGMWPRWQVWFAIILALLAIAEERFHWFECLAEAPAWAWASAVAILLFCLETLGLPGQAIPFVYFQF